MCGMAQRISTTLASAAHSGFRFQKLAMNWLENICQVDDAYSMRIVFSRVFLV